MPPSKESEALAEHFKKLVSNFPQDGNHILERALYEQIRDVAPEAPGVTIEDVTVRGDAVDIPCKLFKPEGTSSAKHVILYMHGGGFSFGSPDGHRKLTAHLAKASQWPLLSVHYRLSPEHKFPAALDDCVSAYQHLLSNGYEARNIAVAGDSCGGGLSHSVPLACIKRGLPMPGASVSLSPWYDLTSQSGGTMGSNKDVDFINTAPFVKMLSDRYVEGSGYDKADPLISPLFASEADLKKLPPTWLSIAGCDMLRDHGERMGEMLKAQGVEVVVEVHEGQQHVMEFLAGAAPEANGSLERIGEWLRKIIGT